MLLEINWKPLWVLYGYYRQTDRQTDRQLFRSQLLLYASLVTIQTARFALKICLGVS
jgi:hypothetical protein